MPTHDKEQEKSIEQLEQVVLQIVKSFYRNQWEGVVENAETAAMLASHCNDIENSYERGRFSEAQDGDERDTESTLKGEEQVPARSDKLGGFGMLRDKARQLLEWE